MLEFVKDNWHLTLGLVLTLLSVIFGSRGIIGWWRERNKDENVSQKSGDKIIDALKSALLLITFLSALVVTIIIQLLISPEIIPSEEYVKAEDYFLRAEEYYELEDINSAKPYYEQAALHYQKAADGYNKKEGESYNYANAMFKLGKCYINTETDKAKEPYEKALAAYSINPGSNRSDIAKVNHSLGFWHYKNAESDEDYRVALKFSETAKDLKEKLFGESHEETARTYDNMGLIHRKLKEYDEALHWHIKAYKAVEIKWYKDDMRNTYKIAQAGNAIKYPDPFDIWLEKQMAGH